MRQHIWKGFNEGLVMTQVNAFTWLVCNGLPLPFHSQQRAACPRRRLRRVLEGVEGIVNQS